MLQVSTVPRAWPIYDVDGKISTLKFLPKLCFFGIRLASQRILPQIDTLRIIDRAEILGWSETQTG